MSKLRKTDRVLQALLTHRTYREAAAAAKISERSLYNYLQDPEFEARYKAARDDIIRGVANHLREQMSEAVGVISEIMRDKDTRPYSRLEAAKAILDYSAKFIENTDILERIEKLERSADDEQDGN